jgi:hypothetical protein
MPIVSPEASAVTSVGAQNSETAPEANSVVARSTAPTKPPPKAALPGMPKPSSGAPPKVQTETHLALTEAEAVPLSLPLVVSNCAPEYRLSLTHSATTVQTATVSAPVAHNATLEAASAATNTNTVAKPVRTTSS